MIKNLSAVNLQCFELLNRAADVKPPQEKASGNIMEIHEGTKQEMSKIAKKPADD